jgi:hypothetical protein
VLRTAEGAGSILDLLTQFLQVGCEAGFDRIGEVAASQPIRAALQAGAEIVFVRAIESASQLRGSPRLCGRKLARCSAHLLGKVRQVIAHLLAIVDHLVDFLGGRISRRFAGSARGALLRDQVAHVIRLLFLSGGQLIGRLRHGVQASGCVLLLHAPKQASCLAQAVGRTARIGCAGILGSGAPHVVVGLAQAVKRLLGCLLATVGSLSLSAFRGLLGIARLPASLTCLSSGLA